MLQLQINAQAAIKRSLSEMRRAAAEKSPRAFVEIYLSHYRKAPFSRMHLEILDLLLKMSSSRSVREAIAAPRGHAKTTLIGTAYVLWSALYKKEFYILLVTATQDLAKGLLKSVKDEIRNNPHLASDFPDVCGQPPSSTSLERWRASNVSPLKESAPNPSAPCRSLSPKSAPSGRLASRFAPLALGRINTNGWHFAVEMGAARSAQKADPEFYLQVLIAGEISEPPTFAPTSLRTSDLVRLGFSIARNRLLHRVFIALPQWHTCTSSPLVFSLE